MKLSRQVELIENGKKIDQAVRLSTQKKMKQDQ